MTFKQFALGLTASFGIAWIAVVVVPFFALQNPAPISFQEGIDEQEGLYFPKKTGRIANGFQVYQENGCYQCHTQVARPLYAGHDLKRPGLAGLTDDPERGDTRRESNVFDYHGLDFAPIGTTRLGPDLINVGRRVPARMRRQAGDDIPAGEIEGRARDWFLMHLYNPRVFPELANWSVCPPHSFLFEKREIKGQPSNDALDVPVESGYEIIPGAEAEALVDYLMSMRHDDPVPASMDYAPQMPDTDS